MQDQEVKHLARHLIEVVNFYEEHPEMMGGAEVKVKAEAEVTTNIIRWSPGLVSSTSAEGSWRIGDRHAFVIGSGKGNRPILDVSIRAPDAIRNLVLDALRTPSDQKS